MERFGERRRGIAVGALLVLMGAGCANDGGTYVIRDVREVDAPPASFVTSAARFGTARQHWQASLQWDTPDGWSVQPPAAMRIASFVVGDGDDAECSIVMLPGSAGGPQANVNRWRGQMGLEPLDAAAVDALPRQRVLATDAHLLDIEGVYTGMSGAPLQDAGMLGAIADLGGRMLFIKLTGPTEIVRGERERFLEFCEHLRFENAS